MLFPLLTSHADDRAKRRTTARIQSSSGVSSAFPPPHFMKEVLVHRVTQHWNMQGAIGVVLKEKEGDRRMIFFVDHAVGWAIIRALESLPSHRPLTHDLLLHVLSALGGTLRHVVITEAKEGTFYARIVLDCSGESRDLDARPSDAVALAAASKVPIFVEEPLIVQLAAAQDFSKPVPLSILWPLAQNKDAPPPEDPPKA